jgi:hexosaminidase
MDEMLGEEGYQLTIEERNVLLVANSPQGIFRAIQTLRQLLPLDIEKDTVQDRIWEIASGTITDYPAYSYRGAMLDVARHFFSVEDVKTYIDWLARYKMNALHLHLSDDQGWRIEIKSWPKLTEIGGSTEVGGGEGGFFSQEEYRELVEYAHKRHIIIVPEIDMPGHTNAALASYAVLNCDDKQRELYTGTEVGFSTLCTSKDTVYRFVEDVVEEIISLDPYTPYFHVGGDESHVTSKEDYKYFMKKVQDIVTSRDRKMIGWGEIVAIDLNKESVPQIWHSEENAAEAMKQDLNVIMSPGSRTYLDMKYDSTTELGLKWAGYIEVDHAYNWYPDEIYPGLKNENILGLECPLWSETVTNIDEVEFMVFPRLPGYAEIGWTAKEKRNWDEYKKRLAGQKDLFEALEINYYKSPKVPWE